MVLFDLYDFEKSLIYTSEMGRKYDHKYCLCVVFFLLLIYNESEWNVFIKGHVEISNK